MIKVLNNQSIFDIALQYTGSIESVFELLKKNGIEELKIEDGQMLKISDIKNQKLIDYYKNNFVVPASLDITLINELSNDFDDNDFDPNDFT